MFFSVLGKVVPELEESFMSGPEGRITVTK